MSECTVNGLIGRRLGRRAERRAVSVLRAFVCLAAIILGLAPLATAQPPAKAKAKRRDGIAVVELFTSSACRICGDAAANIRRLADDSEIDRRKVYVISFNVDYANSGDRRDPFGRPEFTERQRRYGTFYKLRRIRPPQVFVNGFRAGGNDLSQLEGVTLREIEKRAPRTVKISGLERTAKGTLRVAYEVSGFLRPKQNPLATLYIILVHRRYDERLLAPEPLRGVDGVQSKEAEEDATVFLHTNAALSLQSLRVDKKDAGVVELFPPQGAALDELGVVAFLQDEKSMRIQGADFVSFEDLSFERPARKGAR